LQTKPNLRIHQPASHRIEANEFDISPEPLELTALVREPVALFSALSTAHNSTSICRNGQ
jgi:hypothetical protein